MMMQPTIILLRDGTDASQGKPQLLSNINACQQVVEIVKTTLGPRGMDKLIHNGKSATISNDGATIVQLLDIDHPAAKVVADIAKSQDAEVGDGTTSVMVLAGELLKEAKQFVEDGVHPQLIIKGYRQSLELTMKRLDEIAVDINEKDAAKSRENLIKCAETSLNSKLIGGLSKRYFGEMVVDAVLALDADMDTSLVGIKQVHGGAMQESFLVKGVAFKKTFSYAGFEQQPKSFDNPKIVLLNIELELKAEKDNAEIRISDPSQYQSIVDAEWQIIYDKLAKIANSGAKIVLSKLAIGDLATQYFADRGIFCAGRVPEDDLKRVAKATGGIIQTTVNNMDAAVLGTCARFEEKQLGNERFNLFTGCTNAKTATIVLRGGAEQFIAEAERSLNDALQVVKRAIKNSRIIAGGGATEMEISFFLRSHARTIKGKQQLIINAFAKALEVIPTQLAENAGFDSTDILNKLRQRHAQGDTWAGVDIVNDGVCDTMKSFVWEPVIVKRNYIASACEAACLILSIDESVKGPRSEQEEMQKQQQEYAARRGALKPKLVSK